MKKLLTILILVALLVFVAACNRNGDEETPDATPEPTEAPSTQQEDPPPPDDPDPDPPAALEPATVSWIIISEGNRDDDMVLDEVNRLLAERHGDLNLTLDLVRLGWGEYPERLNLMMLAGEEFDITFLAQWYPPFFAPVAGRGDLHPLDDLLQAYAPDILQQIPDPLWFQALSHGGVTYGIPIVSVYVQTQGLTFNAYYVDKHNFDYQSVRNLRDLEPFLELIQTYEPHLIPFLPGTAANHLTPTARAGGVEPVDWHFLFNPNTRAFSDDFLDEEISLPYWRLMREWFNRGFIAPDAASRTIWGEEMESGQYAVMPNFNFLNDGISSSEALGFRTYDIPIFTPMPIRTANIQNSVLGISRSSRHPDRAMQMINAIWSDPLIYNTLIYGVQGFHWNFTDEAGMMIELTQEGQDGFEGGGNYYQIGGITNRFGLPHLPRTQLDAAIRANLETPASVLMGFSYDISNVETEAAAFHAIIGEVMPLLDTGTVDPDTFIADVISRLESAGRQALLDDLQAQIEAFLD